MANRIIIIGAGAAGLAAGQWLRNSGLNPLIIEARNRIGGRIWTDHTRGPVELGAEFIHGSKAITWEFIDRAGLATEPWPRLVGSGPRRRFAQGQSFPFDEHFLRDGQFLTDDKCYQIMDLCERIEHYSGPERSVAEVVDLWDDIDSALVPFALDRLACLEAADVTHLSASALAQERALYSAGWDNFHIKTGYDALPKHLANGLEIQLNTAVTEIDWHSTSVHLSLQNGHTLTADQVIVTVPLSLLQANIPHFEPPLPSHKQQAIRALAMGHVTKLVMWFTETVWPSFQFLGTDGAVITWWPTGSLDQPALMGYVGGPKALDLAALGSEGAIEKGLCEVVQFFGNKARESFIGGKLVAWSTDPWSRGAYTYTPVGAGQARTELAKSIGNVLFFAGEATLTNGHQATVHGAIESGQRAAGEVLEKRTFRQ